MNRNVKTLKELNLVDDFLFGKVMNDMDICKEFLEELLEIKILKLAIVENQKTIDLLKESKGIRLDVYAKDENGVTYNIEMQKTDSKNLPKRLRYYQGNLDLNSIKKGDDYNQLEKSYIIFICTFDFLGLGRHKYTFKTMCEENLELKLEDDTCKIILNTKGVGNDVNEELIGFLNYIENSNEEVANRSKGTLVKNIHRKVESLKNDRSMEVEFMKFAEMRKEDREEGFIEGKIAVAKNLLDSFDDETIAIKAELDIDVVKKLRTEIEKN